MERTQAIIRPGPVFRPALMASPANQSAALRTSPKATRFDWYRASADPTFDPRSNTASIQAGRDQYRRELVPGEHWAIIGDERALRRYFAQGSWEQGDITVGFMESETSLTVFDWIVPQGNGSAPAGVLDARTFSAKEVVVRGGFTSAPLAGTVSSNGTAVVGVGTQFLIDMVPGDILTVAKVGYVIADIQSDFALTLTTAPVRDWAAIAYARSFDRTLYRPVARIEAIYDTERTYAGSDFTIATDAGGVQWTNPANSPVPGNRYSVTYRYLPTYMITDLGSKDVVIGGRAGMTVMMAKLYKPDTLRR